MNTWRGGSLRMLKSILIPLLLVSTLFSCSGGKDVTESVPSTREQPRKTITDRRNDTFGQVVRGGQLYQQHCEACHGHAGQGAPIWRRRDVNGMFPPPPLNGTGHAWHHSKSVLKAIIENGSQPGTGLMPGWKDRLKDEEIDAVITWFQSKWPAEIYQSWLEIDQRSKHGG